MHLFIFDIHELPKNQLWLKIKPLALAASLSTHEARLLFKTAVTSGRGSEGREAGIKEAANLGWQIPKKSVT